MLYYYSAYGLGIKSVLPLHELAAAEVCADIQIRLGRVSYPRQVREAQQGHEAEGVPWVVTPKGICLFSNRVGTFLVRHGREIIVDPSPNADERALCTLLLGTVLGVLLHQRGLLILHASVIAVNDGAIALLGDQGWGKSTTAAAFHARGHRILADDMMPLDLDGTQNPIMVFPGIPALKLWPDAASYLGSQPETLARIRPESEKRVWSISKGFAQRALPLKCIYVLGEGITHEIVPLKPQEIFFNLLRHSYTLPLLKATGTAPSNLRQCGAVGRHVPMRQLKKQRALTALPDLVRLVEEDVGRVSAETPQ